MRAQNCLFWALESSNCAHSDLDKLMEALFFIRCLWPGLEAARRCTAPSPGAGSPAQASAPAGGVGGSSALRSPFSLAAGAGAAEGQADSPGRVVELISFADSPPAWLEAWKASCRRRQMLKTTSVEDRCFGS